jgi:hypothetical protein
MPFLIEVTGVFPTATEAADALEDAFLRIGAELFASVADPDDSDGVTFPRLSERLSRRSMTLSAWRHPAGSLEIPGRDWDRGEVEANLRQVEIIILALRSDPLRLATRVTVNPTQQSGFDAEGVLGTDLWVLEAFGGRHVRNNNKLSRDLTTLRGSSASHRFFACRPSAIHRVIAGGTWLERIAGASVTCAVIVDAPLKLLRVS